MASSVRFSSPLNSTGEEVASLTVTSVPYQESKDLSLRLYVPAENFTVAVTTSVLSAIAVI